MLPKSKFHGNVMKMGHRFLECTVCHGSSLEPRILSCSHTAPLGLPSSSFSAWKVMAAPEGVCIITCIPEQHGSQGCTWSVCIITCVPDLWERSRTPLSFSFQRMENFPAQQLLFRSSACGEMRYFCLLWVSSRLKEPCCPQLWLCHGLPPALAPAVGTQQSMD